MEKWNFDQLFAGENTDKLKAQNAFLDGIKVLRREAAKNYARLVLAGEPGQAALGHVTGYDAAVEALIADPRMADLKAWAEKENERLSEERVRGMLDDAIAKVFKR